MVDGIDVGLVVAFRHGMFRVYISFSLFSLGAAHDGADHGVVREAGPVAAGGLYESLRRGVLPELGLEGAVLHGGAVGGCCLVAGPGPVFAGLPRLCGQHGGQEWSACGACRGSRAAAAPHDSLCSNALQS